MIALTCIVVVATILLLVAYYLTSFFIFHGKAAKPYVTDAKRKKVTTTTTDESMQIDDTKADDDDDSDKDNDDDNSITTKSKDDDNSSNKKQPPPPVVYLQRSNHDDADDKLIDLARARRAVPDVGIPTELASYKIGGKTIGKYKNWATSQRRLIDITHTINDGLRHCHNHVSETLGVTVAEDFIVRLHQDTGGEIMKMSMNAIVSTITMLGHFLLLASTVTRHEIREKAIELVRRWVVSPRQLTDKRRVSSASDIVQLTGPWLLANYLTEPYKTFEEMVQRSEDFLYARELMRLKTKNQVGELGVHMDGSYFDGNGTLALDGLYRLADPNVAYVFGLVVIDGDPMVRAFPEKLWSRVNDVISHPTVHQGLIGVNVFQDPDSFTVAANHHAPYGVRVMPLCKYLRVFTETHYFSVRGLSTRLPFYNRQTMPENSPQYSVQYRDVLTDTSSAPIVTFPNHGLVVAADAATPKPIRMQWQGPNVVRYPQEGRSVVFKFRQFGILYQTYKVSEFGDYRINELLIANTNLGVIMDLVELENHSSTTAYKYYGADLANGLPTQPLACTRYQTTIEFSAADTTKSTTVVVDAPFPKFPITVYPNIELHLVKDNYVVLCDDKKPRVCCPFECETESDTIELTEINATFKFDADDNQWVVQRARK